MNMMTKLLLAGALVGAGAPAWAHQDLTEPPQGERRDAAAPGDDEARAVEDAPVLRKNVEAALQRDPTLRSRRIDVILRRCHVDGTSERCNVTLTGTVDSQAERAAAERAARVKGVVLIDNRLQLAEGAAGAIPDGDLTGKVREQLRADDTLKQYVISVTTSDGVVTLVGTVQSGGARRLAEEIAKKTPGVKQVDNSLRVEPQLSVTP
jgi:osmotically-inducible protein OsmY